MAGANNRALKAAGIPKATIQTLRVEHGAGLSLRSAIAVARERKLPIGNAAEHLERRDAKAAKRPEAQQAAADFRAKAAERMKAALAARPAPPAPKKSGGSIRGRISDLRRLPMSKTGLDVRATPAVMKEYFAPNLAVGADVGRRKRLADLTDALRRAVMKAPPGTTTVRFQVGALGSGGPKGMGSFQRFDLKARLLKGKGKGGRDMVAINMVGGSRAKQAIEDQRRTLQGEASASGRGIVRENGALRIQGRWNASVPFKHRGENVYAVHNQGQLARVVRDDGSVVRNSDAIKRGARVLRAMAARGKAGPSAAMKRGEAMRAATTAANNEAARRAALVASSAAKRNRTNPRVISGSGSRLTSVAADFTHRGQSYSVERDRVGTRVLDGRGNPIRKPTKALRQRAERVMSATMARVNSDTKSVPVVR